MIVAVRGFRYTVALDVVVVTVVCDDVMGRGGEENLSIVEWG